MPKQDLAEIMVMRHLFYFFGPFNKTTLTSANAILLKELTSIYKIVIDETANKKNSLLIISPGWEREKGDANKQLVNAWKEVFAHAISKIGRGRIVLGTSEKDYKLKKQVRDFAKGKKVRIMDCGEYLGHCPLEEVISLKGKLIKNGIDATYVASRLAGITMPSRLRRSKGVVYTTPKRPRKNLIKLLGQMNIFKRKKKGRI